MSEGKRKNMTPRVLTLVVDAERLVRYQEGVEKGRSWGSLKGE